MTELPASLRDTPRLDRWLAFPPGRVRLSVGKVEVGQGIGTALAQIAAEELDVALPRLDVFAGDTDAAPDEGVTASSLSIEVSGASVRLVCAEARAAMLAEAARRLNCAAGDLSIEDGAVRQLGQPTGQSLWTLSDALAREATGRAVPKSPATYRVVGQDAARRDLPGKLFGGGFVHDLLPPGVLHARVLRQPSTGARLLAVDAAAIAHVGAEMVRSGDFCAVLAPDESVAEAAALAARPRWENVTCLSPAHQEAEWLVAQPAADSELGTPPPPAGARVAALYTRGYVSHAPLGPSCALAEFSAQRLTVWSHSRGVYPLRAAIAAVTGLDAAAVSVRHVQGAGGYGMTGADDAAVDAAVLALARPGRPIRVQWRREDEFGSEPVGPAMAIRLEAGLEHGYPVAWSAEIWSPSHVQRGAPPLARRALPDPPALPPPVEPTQALGGGATRNAMPLYDIAARYVLLHLTQAPPVRTGALRGLGALANVFAIECFIDELAEAAAVDPAAYRLALLSDGRAKAVVERAAAMADWPSRGPPGSGRGLGLGFARYKNRSAYAAVVAAVSVETEVRLEHIWCAADCGLAINPAIARDQLEGGIVQAASMVLKEQVTLDGSGVATLTWADYPILRFSEVPEIDVELIGAPTDPSLGVGEATMGPTAGAIGNAVAHALGTRLRALPFTRARIAATLLA